MTLSDLEEALSYANDVTVPDLLEQGEDPELIRGQLASMAIRLTDSLSKVSEFQGMPHQLRLIG